MSQQQFSSPESRLDAETVKRVIERAAKLQQAHLETVSPDQLEALASEVGIDPEFVRRALSEPETETVVAPQTKTVRRIVRRKVARKKAQIDGLTARQVRTALTPGALYAIFAALAMLGMGYGGRPNSEITLLLLQPAILTAYFAQKQPHRRMGALVGLGLGLFPILAEAMTSNSWGGGIPVGFAFFYGPVLAALGFGATAMRKWLDERNAEEVIEEIIVEPAR